MAGRRPKPATLHVVQGTHQPCRHGSKKESKDSRCKRGIPDMPEGMPERAVAAWARIAPLLDRAGVLTHADGVALEVLCVAYADWLEAGDAITSRGHVYETASTAGERVLKANPAVAMRSDADRRIRAWLIEFGLTPAARAKVIAGNKEGPASADPWAEFA